MVRLLVAFLERVFVFVRVFDAAPALLEAALGAGGSVNFVLGLRTISAPQQVRGSSAFFLRGMTVNFLHVAHSYSPAGISIITCDPFSIVLLAAAFAADALVLS